MDKEDEICGCGECADCIKLTKRIQEKLTDEQKSFDRYMNRPAGSGKDDEDN